jgi:hypothetical protein
MPSQTAPWFACPALFMTEPPFLMPRCTYVCSNHYCVLKYDDGDYDVAKLPKVTVEWAALWHRNMEVPVSNLGPETG